MPHMKITIDPNKCVGAGMCALTAPKVFAQDDDGWGEVLPGRENDSDDPMVKEAVRACPQGAISLSDD